jgi:Spy/CpxP family protein refolding chaperone
MNRLLGTSTLALSLALASLAAGCGGSTAVEGPTATAEGVATKAPLNVVVHGHIKLAAEALADIPLRPSQRPQIETLATNADTLHVAVRTARHDLMLALATQVAAGQIDKTALQPKVDAIGTAALAAQTGERAALTQLHGILDASQRSLFVDALQTRMQAAHGSHMHNGGGWKDRYADLNLTEAQQSQIETILHATFSGHHGDWKGGLDRGQKTLDAFRGDSFVIDQVAPAVDIQAKTAQMTSRFIDIAQQVLPILTADQRTLAAQKIQARVAASAATPEVEEKAADPLF